MREGTVVRNVGRVGKWRVGVVAFAVEAGSTAEWELARRGLPLTYVRRGAGPRTRLSYVVRAFVPRKGLVYLWPREGTLEEVRDAGAWRD